MRHSTPTRTVQNPFADIDVADVARLGSLDLAAIPVDRSFAGWTGPDPRRPTLDRLKKDYPIEVATTAHTWGIAGWECIVRRNPRRAVVIVCLHGMVVDRWVTSSRTKALALADRCFDLTVESVTGCLGLASEHLSTIHPALWSSEETLDLVEPRWLYQALTGLHVDFVNTLIMLATPAEVLEFFALHPDHEPTGDLVNTFPGVEQLAEGRPILNLLWAHPPRADQASAEEVDRLLGGAYTTV